MKVTAPKYYQNEVVKNALEIFRWAESQISTATDDASRIAATAHNGCILLEAPTGSGKTRMAGTIAASFSDTEKHRDNAKIVWFWFTPFAGLVEQATISLQESFHDLRVKSLQNERRIHNAASGDVYVATWAAVATSNRSTRKVRVSGDTSLSLDEFIEQLRASDFRIGVVVDEAHHGFTEETEAVAFYRDIMRPDFTLLITATPDDRDVEQFRVATGIAQLHRISVSRKDAVDAGLIKEGIKSVAYIAPDDQKQLVDFPLTALTDAWQMHRAIHSRLEAEGINLVPLMLVQVGNTDTAVDEARERLKRIGVPDDAIAWYTSKDPNDDLLTVALDERYQVLIFKVAIAMGFDAPRAFTLVSLRSAKSTNFGIQVVGRILRVHSKLQPRAVDKTLPELLRFGYVFLADSENQTGLTTAGEKINAIKTEMSEICPYTMIVQVAGEKQIQVVQDGQTTLLPERWVPPVRTLPPVPQEQIAGTGKEISAPELPGLLSGLVLPEESRENIGKQPVQKQETPLAQIAGNKICKIKPDVPRVYKTERLPLSTDALVACISTCIEMDERVLAASQRRNLKLTRRESDVFGETDDKDGSYQARLSDSEITRRAQGVLFDAEHLDPRELFSALLKRLQREYENQGWETSEESLVRALNLIMATYPRLIRKAEKKCSAEYKETVATAPLPESVEMAAGGRKSARNIYGVMPQDLNEPERKFVELLDADTSGTVEWWWRNEPRKPWSIALVLPTGDRYFPDFVIKVKGRIKGDGLALVEIKGNHILNGDDSLDKAEAEHKVYRRPLMVVREDSGRFMTVQYNERYDKNELHQVFRVENLTEY